MVIQRWHHGDRATQPNHGHLYNCNMFLSWGRGKKFKPSEYVQPPNRFIRITQLGIPSHDVRFVETSLFN